MAPCSSARPFIIASKGRLQKNSPTSLHVCTYYVSNYTVFLITLNSNRRSTSFVLIIKYMFMYKHLPVLILTHIHQKQYALATNKIKSFHLAQFLEGFLFSTWMIELPILFKYALTLLIACIYLKHGLLTSSYCSNLHSDVDSFLFISSNPSHVPAQPI